MAASRHVRIVLSVLVAVRAMGAVDEASCAASEPSCLAPSLMQRSALLMATQKGEAATVSLSVDVKTTSNVDYLSGPDFLQGDAAWKERLASLRAHEPDAFSVEHHASNNNEVSLATAAPLTVLYALAHYHQHIFPSGEVPSPLRVHVIGAAYPFEGRGDWRLLGEAMPPDVELEVSLVLGTPEQADGVPEIDIRKQELCRQHGNTLVKCIEDFYQGVMHKIEPAHVAVMFNPGFPQVHRRTWDATLLYLLAKRIPCAVSAQVSNLKGWPTPGKAWDSSFTEYVNEDFPVNDTLVAYGADTWGATGSPFPIVEREDDTVKIIKNAVVELFQGVRPGISLPRAPRDVPKADLDFLRGLDWAKAEQLADDGTMHDEMRLALETPVSEAFVRAQDNVYLHYLDLERLNGNMGKKSEKVQKKLKRIMEKMRRQEPVQAKDWVFLKIQLDLD